MDLRRQPYLHIFFCLILLFLAALTFAPPKASTGAILTPDAYLPYIVQDGTPFPGPLPDLMVPYASITFKDPTCYDGHSRLGLRVEINNIDQGDADSFVVSIDQSSVTVDGLAGGSSTSVWVQDWSGQPLIFVDATDRILESNEGNNVFNKILPVPTRPIPCAFLTATPNFLDSSE